MLFFFVPFVFFFCPNTGKLAEQEAAHECRVRDSSANNEVATELIKITVIKSNRHPVPKSHKNAANAELMKRDRK